MTQAGEATLAGHVLNVREVRQETSDAVSVVFEIPEELSEAFEFKAGQFLTLGIPSDQTGLAARCYSLSSTPHSSEHRVTVKRTVDGFASGWITQELKAGDSLRVLPPSGIFTPKDPEADLLLFAGGSGITPVISIARTSLETTSAKVVLFYANRDEQSVIFASDLQQLAATYPDRFVVVHWLEAVQGLPSQEQLASFAEIFADRTAFVCGPGPFMKATTAALKDLGFPRDRRHQEKFISLGGNPFGDVVAANEAAQTLHEADDHEAGDDQASQGADDPAATGSGKVVAVECELDGETHSFDDWDGGDPLLVFLEKKGLAAPFSCREGKCSACACIVTEGDIAMAHNEILDKADLDEGIRLTCQAYPDSDNLKISYDA